MVTPMPLIEEYGSEAVRYWACNGRPGVDTAVDFGRDEDRAPSRHQDPQRLAFRPRILRGGRRPVPGHPNRSTARCCAGLAEVVDTATAAFESFDYARALEVAEKSFWNWTDDYVELVKSRAYEGGPGAASAHAALQLALSVYLRLFAPFLPFVTEEVWSWWRKGSVHRASWPDSAEFAGIDGDPAVLAAVSPVLGAVRRAKSDAKVSMRAEVASIVVTADEQTLAAVRRARPTCSRRHGPHLSNTSKATSGWW